MESFFDIVEGRRSIRKFQDKDVSTSDLNRILEAVRWSPSWTNLQCWEIVAVRDPEIKKRLQETLPPKGNPAVKAVGNAPVVLAVAAKLKASGFYKDKASTVLGDWYMFDLGIAVQTLCLSARALGLGTVIVGLYDIAKAADVLGVPDGYQQVALIPLGYPDQSPKAPKRKEIADFVHLDRFGNKG
ncbi:MAG: nitroreductase family protein [Deltaproteobacteria bacterium]|jgi:nitroreductase|nr:nitroreductase family protein [Deltaproteobacteria bacterium]